MEQIKKCLISRYDETITNPPFLTIPIDEVDVPKPTNDFLGEEFCRRLTDACKEKGYDFKFYSNSATEEFDYEVVVR